MSRSAIEASQDVAVSADRTTMPFIRFRNGALCALLVAACLWIAWPVSNMGFVDDFSYAKTAKAFASTGHFVYNGWATAMLGWQIVWGALFIKLFGFSFVVLRVSMLPIAMTTVFLFHQILLRFGVNARNAVFGTLTLGLSPLFMPLADSFMTDVPGLLIILICIYCCQRALASTTARAALLWLVLAAGSNVVGGTVRQIAWLGALVLVPTAGWMLRTKRGVFPLTLLLWAASGLSIAAIMWWFSSQPYSIPESSLSELIRDVGPLAVLFVPLFLGGSLLCSLLVVYPLIVPWVRRARHLRAATARKALLVLVGCEAVQFALHMYMPWLGHVLITEFGRGRIPGVAIPAPETFLLPIWARALFGAVVIGTGLLLAVDVQNSIRTIGGLRKVFLRPEIALLTPFVIAYFLLLCPRASIGALFDRYLLGILPAFIPWLLLFFQSRVGSRLPAASVFWLAVWAAMGIAGTHDWFAWQRARGAAFGEVLASGVPATEVQGGFESDGWTQLQEGYMNNWLLVNPPHAYVKPSPETHIPVQCRADYADATLAIRPKYAVGFNPEWCFAETNYPPVEYTRWLPPFHETVFVRRIAVSR